MNGDGEYAIKPSKRARSSAQELLLADLGNQRPISVT
jgi:hypothetical protein